MFAEARKAEHAALTDPRTSCFYARRTLELAVVWFFEAEGGRQLFSTLEQVRANALAA